jgi:hypothetical protein
LLLLAGSAPRHRLEQMGKRRTVALALVGVITAANVLALGALIASLLSGNEKSGAELLLKGATIWSTNVITFGLLFWEFGRGGPIHRSRPDPPPRDFQFPQDENPRLAEPNWYPRLADYVYVSFTNAIAFSPTDAMPLTRRVKMSRAGNSRLEGPGARPLPLGSVRRQCGLDGDRLPGPQHRALGRATGSRRRDLAGGADDPPLADRAARPAHPHGPALHLAPTRPLALAGGLRRGADQDQGAASRSLIHLDRLPLICRTLGRRELLGIGHGTTTAGPLDLQRHTT